MDKPKDYSKYFNSDGTRKICPHQFGLDEYREWIRRQKEIAYSLMTNDERKMYREFKRYQKDKYTY